MTYRYDADQQRIAQTGPTGSTYFLRGLAEELLTEWRSLGVTAQAKDYVYAGARLVASVSRKVTEPPPAPVCPTTTDLVNLDFESGASLTALGFEYVTDIDTQAGEGLGGSGWGVRGLPGATASQKYYGEAELPVAHTGRHFKIEADFDHADAGESRYGYSAFELRYGGYFLSLYHGVGDAGAQRDKLQLYFDPDPDGFWESRSGVIVPGTRQRITMCGTLSTLDENDDVNTDGSVRVYVDGVLKVELTGKQLGYGEGVNRVFINPMGRFDHFKFSKD